MDKTTCFCHKVTLRLVLCSFLLGDILEGSRAHFCDFFNWLFYPLNSWKVFLNLTKVMYFKPRPVRSFSVVILLLLKVIVYMFFTATIPCCMLGTMMIFLHGKEFFPVGKIYCYFHATWLPCKSFSPIVFFQNVAELFLLTCLHLLVKTYFNWFNLLFKRNSHFLASPCHLLRAYWKDSTLLSEKDMKWNCTKLFVGVTLATEYTWTRSRSMLF